MPDEPTILPTEIECETGTFKPVLSCSHDELIDAAMTYMSKALEYREYAGALSNLAARRRSETGTDPRGRATARTPHGDESVTGASPPVTRPSVVPSPEPTDIPT